MPSLRKRGNTWRAEIYRNGKRESATFKTRAEAREWAQVREEELSAGYQSNGETLGDAFDLYAREVSPARRGARWEILRLLMLKRDKIAAITMRDLTAGDFAGWRDRRLKTVKPGTVLREKNLIRSVVETARKEWGWLRDNAMKDVRWPPKPKARDRRISDDEIQRICLSLGYVDGAPRNASQRVAVAFLFALETAMRSGEITGLEWNRVHIEARYVQLEKTKNGDSRKVPLSNEAARLLNLLPRSGSSTFNLTRELRDALFRKARDKAGIVDLTFHDSRHEAVTRLSRKLDVLALARMIGHRDLKSLQVYYNETATEIARRLG